MMREKILIALSGNNPFESDFLNPLLSEHSNNYLGWFGSVEDMKSSSLRGYSEVTTGCDPVKILNFLCSSDIKKVVLFDYNPLLTFEMLKLLKIFLKTTLLW